MALIGIMLVKNEEGRYLERVLAQMKSVCDRIIVLDDASDDATRFICKSYGADVYESGTSLWGTNELIQRQRLWDLATQEAQDGDWILCLDADETITHIGKLKALITFAESYPEVGSLAFPLYDMWDKTHYRDDALWNAHLRKWIVCVKYNSGREYRWRETPLHCGRFPLNAETDHIASENSLKIQHWGWAGPADREAKYRRYMEADPEGKNGILEQYQSILDPNPVLKEFLYENFDSGSGSPKAAHI